MNFKDPKGWFFVIILLMLTVFFIFKIDWSSASFFETKTEYLIIENIGKESCLDCHENTNGYSQYHDPNLIGCASCHLGNPNSLKIENAHKGMVLIPGNLSNADKTCGKCHVNELNKIKHSLMTTNSGIVAVDKFIFGETDSPDYQFHIKDLQFTAADKHLRDLCANCHLGAEKNELGPIDQLSRGGGCNACHLNYSENAIIDLDKYVNSNYKELPKAHPSTDIFVSDEHCFGCHSRSSRISTNYEGWHETLLDEKEILNKKGFKVFEDKRVYSYQGEDVHHAKGMLCIDCHSSHEVMGDGKDYLHEEKAVSLSCADCHFKEKPNTIAFEELDTESSLVFLHRKYQHTDKRILIAEKDGHPLVNTFVNDNDEVFLISKKNGELHEVKKQSEICSRDNAHKNVSCSTCHAQWAPKCIGCHNSFDKNDKSGYDLLDKKMVTGQWIEHVFEFGVDKPSMGVRMDGDKSTIEPAIPGMILTIDHDSFENDKKKGTSFHRLYAPNSPHTISKTARDCKSCHSSPVALGYGEGSLVYNTTNGYGEWLFSPEYDLNPNDNLPEDAWIPFLEKQKAKVFSTRTDFRPFTITEQKRILLVGACLQCHKDNSKIMKKTIEFGLDPLLLKISKACILPK